MVSFRCGVELVKFAREVLSSYFKCGKAELPTKIDEELKKEMLEKRGVFVTLHSYPSYELRGCIGIPYPEKELIRAVRDATLASAFEDPRFEPLTEKELEKIVIEISILTEPKKIIVKDPKEYLEKIKIGRDGLIIKYGWYAGLLLPQVPVEEGWNEEEYLSWLCYKAGLPGDTWYDEKAEIYSFQAQIFYEEKPNGEIKEKKLI
ncbi:MAG: TIGR00296 family protein [Candidatus Aenigmatarchaeota archaeon]